MNYINTMPNAEQVEPCCTREQAAQLLDDLLAEYQGLSPNQRWLVRSVLQAVSQSTSKAGLDTGLVDRRRHSRSEGSLTAIENAAYSVLRQTNMCVHEQTCAAC
jgi:hypothetical protein